MKVASKKSARVRNLKQQEVDEAIINRYKMMHEVLQHQTPTSVG